MELRRVWLMVCWIWDRVAWVENVRTLEELDEYEEEFMIELVDQGLTNVQKYFGSVIADRREALVRLIILSN